MHTQSIQSSMSTTTITSLPSSTITISFVPIKIKLFRSKKKKSLLVIEGTCINGSTNRILPGIKGLVHIRQTSTTLPVFIDSVECLAKSLLLDDVQSNTMEYLNKGCWVEVNNTKRIVLKAHANIERNRRGDRLIECTDMLAIHDIDDDSYLPINTNDEYNEYIIQQHDEGTDDIVASNTINVKSERHKIFAHWLVDTYGKERLSRGSGVLDVAGGNGMISRTLNGMGIRSTLLDPNPRHDSGEETSDDGKYSSTCHSSLFGVLPYPLNGDGTDLTSRDDDIGNIVKNISLICGLHPDEATEPIVTLALRLNVPFAIL